MIRSFALFFVALALVIQYAPELNRARAADAIALKKRARA